jgi:hypothetical protein
LLGALTAEIGEVLAHALRIASLRRSMTKKTAASAPDAESLKLTRLIPKG